MLNPFLAYGLVCSQHMHDLYNWPDMLPCTIYIHFNSGVNAILLFPKYNRLEYNIFPNSHSMQLYIHNVIIWHDSTNCMKILVSEILQYLRIIALQRLFYQSNKWRYMNNHIILLCSIHRLGEFIKYLSSHPSRCLFTTVHVYSRSLIPSHMSPYLICSLTCPIRLRVVWRSEDVTTLC